MKVIGRIVLGLAVVAVFLCVAVNFLFWIGAKEEAKAEALASVDADLVVEQYVTENNDISGLVYAKNEMHWEKGKLATMRFTQRYATEDQAAQAYAGKAATLGAATQLMLDGLEVSYYLSTEDFEEVTYAKMYEAMESNSGWQIVDELSGEYPTGTSLNGE